MISQIPPTILKDANLSVKKSSKSLPFKENLKNKNT